MNWNAIGAIGQILGSLATFVTVGFLFVQVHDNETETRRAVAQTRAERDMQINFAMVDDQRLVQSWAKLSRWLNANKSVTRATEATWNSAALAFGNVAEQADL